MFGQLLLGVAGNRGVRSLVTGSSLSRPVVARFVAGDDVAAATAATRTLTRDGVAVSLDRLGEDITEPAQADQTVAGYRELLDTLAAEGLTAGPAGANEISIKLSALGQGLGATGPRRATERALDLVAHATSHGVDVTIDMEDHTRVEDTLATVRELRAEFPRTGCVLQAMLRRTEADARALAHEGSRVRLVKGAYNEPPEVAYPAKADVDKAYVRALRILLDGGAYPMIATHDLRIVNLAEELLAGKPTSTAEFQMLYGIRSPEQLRLARTHTVRVYVPYGTDWYGYFSRRLAERPANLAFFARSLVAG